MTFKSILGKQLENMRLEDIIKKVTDEVTLNKVSRAVYLLGKQR